MATSTSARNLGLALISALCLHAVLLAQKLVFKEVYAEKKQRLTVTMHEQEVSQPEPQKQLLTEQHTADLIEKVIKPTFSALKLDGLMVVAHPAINQQPRIAIQTSRRSNLFKNWLKSETDRFSSQNLNAVSSFDKTFEASLLNQSPKELSPYNPKAVPRGDTIFATELKGKRTCFVKDMNLLDITVGAMFISKGCTPKKKFDLKLNQSNNGWSNR